MPCGPQESKTPLTGVFVIVRKGIGSALICFGICSLNFSRFTDCFLACLVIKCLAFPQDRIVAFIDLIGIDARFLLIDVYDRVFTEKRFILSQQGVHEVDIFFNWPWRKGILVEAYSPFGHGELFKNQEIAAIAEKYKASISQLAIRYCLQLSLLPLPKTASPGHMRTNAEVDFVIGEEDMERLKNVRQIENYGAHSKFPVYGRK